MAALQVAEDGSYGLTKEQELKCWEAFSAFDKDSSGYIDSHQLRIVLEMMGQRPTEQQIFKMISQVDQDHTGHIVDAFIAMGGGPGKEGFIDAKKLIKVIKEDFEMTIDIEKLIKDIDTDNSGKIEYAEFKNLLSSN